MMTNMTESREFNSLQIEAANRKKGIKTSTIQIKTPETNNPAMVQEDML